ncbi:transposase [Ectothiorhodospira haloalkaliphila]|uniref:Transposase n=1 Tax=Ectothiorhodospira haloalkaliphila TaxID=421628 RepID=W8KWZ7_9GAMM|nr:transposase [Ectothiorhodospira haloalkaliphila]AHK80076.1 transposase [Ectothiorhodospira haloalkaliphila]
MPRPRSQQISITDTPYYHVVSRCVRRTFLCGQDQTTGKSYEHRRQWIEDRIRLLASLFAVDIAAYAVMSNHYHVVVKLDPAQAEQWSDDEVLRRWSCLFKGPLLVQRYLAGDPQESYELAQVAEFTQCYRQRLADLSWFMKCLNEPIARQANQEDGCTGHFWEARFKSQALRTEAALLSCMAYVDLNPVRAGMAATPETSEHTSIRERIAPRFDLAQAVREQMQKESLLRFDGPVKPLLPFEGAFADREQPGIPFAFEDYLALVDFTGRAIDPRKKGAIASTQPSILQRLGFTPDQWLNQSTRFEALYRPQRRRSAA